MKKGIVAVMIIGALLFGALNYHFILFDDSIKIMKKADLSFHNTFVDGRGIKLLTLIAEPALVKSGIKNLVDKESLSVPR
jgi:hypothetical protein